MGYSSPRASFGAAASRIGVSTAEYEAKRAAGLRWCVGCREWHPEGEFWPDAQRGRRRLCAKASRRGGRR